MTPEEKAREKAEKIIDYWRIDAEIYDECINKVTQALLEARAEGLAQNVKAKLPSFNAKEVKELEQDQEIYEEAKEWGIDLARGDKNSTTFEIARELLIIGFQMCRNRYRTHIEAESQGAVESRPTTVAVDHRGIPTEIWHAINEIRWISSGGGKLSEMRWNDIWAHSEKIYEWIRSLWLPEKPATLVLPSMPEHYTNLVRQNLFDEVVNKIKRLNPHLKIEEKK